jgi:hypothetical protein
VLLTVEENLVSRRFLKEIVAFVVRKDTIQLIVGSQIKTKKSALPIISLLLQVNLINLMIRKSYIVLILTKMITPWIAVSVKSVMKRKMTNRMMKI